MARRVFLHVGLPKTGTTYLQTRMWEQRDRLAELGFLYPGRMRMDHYRAWRDIHLEGRRDRGAWSRLCAEIAAHPGDALVSHEFFSMATPQEAATALEGLAPAEVQVVLTLRAYHLQFPAVWQEALKMGSRRSFSDFMTQVVAPDREHSELTGAWSWESQDIPAVLGSWATAVPSDRITVVTVPPPGSPRDWLWNRWCEALGLDADRLDREAPFANESLGAAQAALMQHVTPLVFSGPLAKVHERHRWLRQYFGHEVLGPQQGVRFAPRPAEVERLRVLADEAVAAIKASGAAVVGDLDDLLLPDEVTGAHPDDVSDSEVIETAALAIEQMIRDVRRLTRQNQQLRQRVRRTPPGRLGRLRRKLLSRGEAR